jgi:hypothetical protein
MLINHFNTTILHIMIRFLSYNIQGIADVSLFTHVVSTIGANVVAVQGCNNLNYEFVMREMKKIGFVYEHFPENFDRTEYELLFSALPITKKRYSLFQRTKQHSGMTVYHVKSDDDEVCIVTSKFDDASDCVAARRLQVEEIFSFLHANKGIFGGDTCVAEWQTLVTLRSGIKDAWREKGTSRNCYTRGVDRPDRFWYTDNLECTEYKSLEIYPNVNRLAIFASFEKYKQE